LEKTFLETQMHSKKNYMVSLIKQITKILISIVFWPLKTFIPKKAIIILQTYDPYVYCENTKYLFQYFSENTDYEVYWFTESEQIKEYISSKGYNYITKKKPFNLVWLALRARVVIDSGTMYFYPYLIGKNTIKISTLHGNGPKATLSTHESLKKNLDQIIKINNFDYVNFTSQYSATMIGQRTFRLPPKKTICLGYPRCDQYFDKKFVEVRRQRKEVTKQLNDIFPNNGNVILYTPTWRTYDLEFPLVLMKGYTYDKFNVFLKKNNIFFFYTTHSMENHKHVIPDSDHIKYIKREGNPFFDINLLMMEVDILLNDYSTTSTEFSLLKRPQIFFMPDYDHYLLEKGFIEDYRAILPGKEVFCVEDFEKTTLACLENPEVYVTKHEKARQVLLERYYDVSLSNSCQSFTKFLHQII
jgi:CDP-glycerol glycerophosphotransferase (TagB/SpsB family)